MSRSHIERPPSKIRGTNLLLLVESVIIMTNVLININKRTILKSVVTRNVLWQGPL